MSCLSILGGGGWGGGVWLAPDFEIEAHGGSLKQEMHHPPGTSLGGFFHHDGLYARKWPFLLFVL
jgi:hypothetical protein